MIFSGSIKGKNREEIAKLLRESAFLIEEGGCVAVESTAENWSVEGEPEDEVTS